MADFANVRSQAIERITGVPQAVQSQMDLAIESRYPNIQLVCLKYPTSAFVKLQSGFGAASIRWRPGRVRSSWSRALRIRSSARCSWWFEKHVLFEYLKQVELGRKMRGALWICVFTFFWLYDFIVFWICMSQICVYYLSVFTYVFLCISKV